ncbi:SRPBCC domain-containing protein [Rhodococcus triatomae]|uniref:Uncharacterized conserved protein YndB, AHSA1/START domain n=1 Tax=Rhodococcus triatomae TaxID=300028 RepID=A0A1G8JKH0_9NOCA|nr:SRPBCC domain-containing protein [Rhodococcus triatomae]QNG19697.1 SRPBCC domain-containing protein [Rhodococcus triatomae]QNG24388.1 SRPBCC domain-containing protein [Rhodococcus triatomae]SDI31591.1 Uncharacterized conserved protein YndB, AHSA1/START domain [Rhodococcus triatomae]
MGSSPTGRTRDVGWEIGVSRSIPFAPDHVWALLADRPQVWLGDGARLPREVGEQWESGDGTVGELRSFRPGDRIRLTWKPVHWSHDSTVQVALTPSARGTTVRFHQERLASSAERVAQRDHWTAVVDRVVAALEPGDRS